MVNPNRFLSRKLWVMEMNVEGHTSNDENTQGGGANPPSTGLAPDALPEVQQPVTAENSPTGVSTKNALSATSSLPTIKRAKSAPHWYALRCTYGQEKKAYDYILQHQGTAYYPTIRRMKLVGGKRKSVEESRLPNIFFIYGTKEEAQSFVYDNEHLPYLRFYYRHYHVGASIVKEPLIVPDVQMESFRIICETKAEDVLLITGHVNKFESGQLVCITDGDFKGVVGKVVRYHGQQRVVVILDGLLTVATAYIPRAFLKVLEV